MANFSQDPLILNRWSGPERPSAMTLSVSTIFSTKDSLSFVNWSKGGRTKSGWVQYFVNWIKGGRVRPRYDYEVQAQLMQHTFGNVTYGEVSRDERDYNVEKSQVF